MTGVADGMVDRSLLPDAALEFVVVTDTHYMPDSGVPGLEFASRRRQAARAERALAAIAGLDVAFVVHLGDLVQAFPETVDFDAAIDAALDQLRRCGVNPHMVAGNHDVGDKPDPTMPTDWVTPETLAAYHVRFGRSWYSWDKAGAHFVVLNSQIMNSALADAAEQQDWFEADLAAIGDRPAYLFLHLAPFLVDQREPGLGHYDNIDQPARGWLVDIVKKHSVQALFAGHSHFSFFNRIGAARSFVVPSTSFTRPGFSEVFSSCPPPERGRDDVAKLGFFLVRIQGDGPRVHFLRAADAIEPGTATTPERALVTRLPHDLPHSPLGVTLRHPLAPAGEVPIAWPSSIRQPARNDYPLLACLELGVRYIRVPASDLEDTLQRERLAALRDEGVLVSATWIWSDRLDIGDAVVRHRDVLDGFEIQIPNQDVPGDACLRSIQHIRSVSNRPVTLATLVPREVVRGKQHPRTRIGYRTTELPALDASLAAAGVQVDRVLCRVDAECGPWETMGHARELPKFSQIGAIDWAVELSAPDEQKQVIRAAEAMMAAALLPGSRLYLEPLLDLDRTMDAPYGLLDRLCNPRPAFRTVRTLNTVLFGDLETREAAPAPQLENAATFCLRGSKTTMLLIAPDSSTCDGVTVAVSTLRTLAPGRESVRFFDLTRATVQQHAAASDERIDLRGPALLLFASASGSAGR
jgi:hypothetical protein